MLYSNQCWFVVSSSKWSERFLKPKDSLLCQFNVIKPIHKFPSRRLCTHADGLQVNDCAAKAEAGKCSWHMISHPSLRTCDAPYFHQQKGYSLKRNITLSRLHFISCSATPRKGQQSPLFITSIYKSTGASLHRSSPFPSEALHPNSVS